MMMSGENCLNFSFFKPSRRTVSSTGIPSCSEQRISSFTNAVNVAGCSVSPCAVGQHRRTSQNVCCGKGGWCRVLADGWWLVARVRFSNRFDLYLLSHILYPLKKLQYIHLALQKYCTIMYTRTNAQMS